MTRKTYLSYEDASKAAQAAGIKTIVAFHAWYRQVPGMPSDPWKRYASSWVNMSVFLTGVDTLTKCSYEEAKKLALENKVRNLMDYENLCDSYPQLPRNPATFYKAEWVSFNNFLMAPGETVFDYDSLIVELKKLGVNSESKYRRLAANDFRFPKNPPFYYKEKWQGWRELFGKQKHVKKYTYAEARQAVKRLGIKTFSEYTQLKKYQLDPALPSTPSSYYPEWTNWSDFCG